MGNGEPNELLLDNCARDMLLLLSAAHRVWCPWSITPRKRGTFRCFSVFQVTQGTDGIYREAIL